MKFKVAIIGMSASFARASSVTAFWSNIRNKVDGISELPFEERWGSKALFRKGSKPSLFHTYCGQGGIISDELLFDPQAYGIVPNELQEIDADQLVTLDLVRDALADAGIPVSARQPRRLSAGLIVGKILPIGVATYRLLEIVKCLPQITDILQNTIPGISDSQLESFRQAFIKARGEFSSGKGFNSVGNLLASRVANRFNLSGNCYTIDAACASSLVAIQNAVGELQSGNCDLMIAGGVNYPVSQVIWEIFSNMGALAGSNSIRPFHADSDGTLLGEGGGFVVLKRLEEALKDGDRIYAVIEGIGSCSDGRSNSMMAPDTQGQQDACRLAWNGADAGISELGLIECHGTGMPLGDKTEIETLLSFFGPELRRQLPIGSVKSMIGHTLAASGIASVIKTASALYEGILPPSLHCSKPNAMLDGTPFHVQQEAMAWPESKRRLAAVNAFGFGGINSHLILSCEPGLHKPRRTPPASRREVLLLARNSRAALLEALDRKDYTPGNGRYRLAVLQPSADKLALARRVVERGEAWPGKQDVFYSGRNILGQGGKTAFLFPGLGVFVNPDYKELVSAYQLPLDLSLIRQAHTREEIQGSETIVSGYVNFKVLEALGLQPDVLAGHSLGDWTSCIASGIVPAERIPEVLNEVLSAGNLFGHEDYALWSVACSAEKLQNLFREEDGIYLANDNAPGNAILCIARQAREQVLHTLREQKILCYDLGFNVASHHPFIEPTYQAIRPVVDKLPLQAARYQVWNATLAAPYPEEEKAIRDTIYRNMLSPVRFREMTERLYDAGVRVFLQLGIGGLSGFVKDTLSGREDILAMDAVSRNHGTMDMMLRILLALYTEGRDFDPAVAQLKSLSEHSSRAVSLKNNICEGIVRQASLPQVNGVIASASIDPAAVTLDPMLQQSMDSYRRAHTEVLDLWQKRAGKSSAATGAPAAAPAPPPGTVIHEEEFRISHELYPELYDHEIFRHHRDIEIRHRSAVVPMAMMVTVSAKILRRLYPEKHVAAVDNPIALRFLSVTQALTVRIRILAQGGNSFKVVWGDHFSCTILLSDQQPVPPAIGDNWKIYPERRVPFVCSAEEFYRQFYMFHGPAYQGMVREIDQDHSGSLMEVRFPGGCGSLLDSAMQTGAGWLYSSFAAKNLVLPLRMGRLEIFAGLETFENPDLRFLCRTFVQKNTDLEYAYSFEMAYEGRVLMRLDLFQGRKFESNPRIETIYCDIHKERFVSERLEEDLFLIRNDFINSKWTWDMVENAFLDNEERDRLAAMQSVKARQSFILGRIAAKECAKRYLMDKSGDKELFPTQIGIGYDKHHKPYALCPDVMLHRINLSIAHKGPYGVALLGEDQPAGVDIEKIGAGSFEKSAGIVFSPGERQLIDAAPEEQKPLMQTIFWTAKEAYFKYREDSSSGRFIDFEIKSLSPIAPGRYEARWQGRINDMDFISVIWDKDHVITWIKKKTIM